jgi:transposase-like protein
VAKKGQKFQRYSDEERANIISEYHEGNESAKSIAEKYGITSRKTVLTWLKKYRTTGSTNSSKRGRTLKDEAIDYKARYEILKKYQAFLKEQQEKK